MTHIRLVTTTHNEAKSIEALAKGCLEFIDSWVILDDEESDDGTAELAKQFFGHLPGRVIRKPFSQFKSLSDKRNYLYNRLPSTRSGADYLFITQSDEPPSGTIDKSSLTNDIYLVTVEENTLTYKMPLLFKASIPCKWVGDVHEYLDFSDYPDFNPSSYTDLPGLTIHRDGSEATFERRFAEAEVLKTAADNGDTRSMFYLAQTYRDMGWYEQAFSTYMRRANMTGPDEETFYSLYSAGVLMEVIDETIAESLWIRAHNQRPHRAEPLYVLANMYARHGNFGACLKHALAGDALPIPTNDLLWVNEWVYNEGCLNLVNSARKFIQLANDNG